jgi:hypothetical protein
MQEVGLYPIISTSSFYDGLINLNKFFRIAGVIILINVALFELGPLLGIIVVDLMFCPRCASDP